MEATDIIIKPLLSEKTTGLNEMAKPQYVFQVNANANKAMVSAAVATLFKVTPLKVRIINTLGKWKRVRRDYGLTPTVKKAIVTLKAGEKIELVSAKA